MVQKGLNNISMTYIRATILGIITSSLLSACTVSYHIKVNNDKSAFVQTNDFLRGNSKLLRLESSNMIYDLDSVGKPGLALSFTIKDIDSLGQFMPRHVGDSIYFNLQNDTLLVMDITTTSSSPKSRRYYHYYFLITSAKIIQNIELVDGYAKKINPNTLRIRRKSWNIKRKKHPTSVKVIYR